MKITAPILTLVFGNILLILIHAPKGINGKKCQNNENVAENGACIVAPQGFQEKSIGPFDIQDIISSLINPRTISNQFTDILTFQSMIALGWFLAGKFISFLFL